MIEKNYQITGTSLPKEGFRLHETYKSIDVNKVFEVLEGNLAAYRIKNYLPRESCDQIVTNFWNSTEKVARIGYGEDGVEGYFIGASHIEKTTDEYLQEVQKFENAINDLFEGTVNPATLFREAISEYSGKKARPAKQNGLSAGNSKAVYWNSLGKFLLQPHDDFAQLSDPRQKGFEIQNTKRVMAFNFYAEVPPASGQLKIWNIEPDNESRAALNLSHSGFPYPPELLDDFPSLTIPVETNDICVINGNLIHGVLRGNPQASPKNRLLITFFMTQSNNELIWWT